MALTLNAAARNAAADAVTVLLNGGTLEILAGATLLSSHALAATAFGAAVTGVATANAIGDGTGQADGAADTCKLKASDGTVHITGTVTKTDGAGDVKLDNVNIASGQVVKITGATYTQPATV